MGATINSNLENTTRNITTKSEEVGADNVSDQTVKSIMMGSTSKKQNSEVPIENDKTINSVMLGESNLQLDRTIHSMLFDTIGQMQNTLRNVSKPPQLNQSLK